MNDMTLGRYGEAHLYYLREYEPFVYAAFVRQDKLLEHCREVDQTARERLALLIPQLAASAGATEDLKARAPMRWVGLMNACKHQAEELVLREVVYREPVKGTTPELPCGGSGVVFTLSAENNSLRCYRMW